MTGEAEPGDPMGGDRARDWEDVRSYTLEQQEEAELLERQTECTFIWLGKDGHPMGVVMNFLARDGRFWLTATAGPAAPRGRAAAHARPRRGGGGGGSAPGGGSGFSRGEGRSPTRAAASSTT